MRPPLPYDTASPARLAAAKAIAEAAVVFPRLAAQPPRTEGLDPRDARLAVAIYRLTVQRWGTLNYLLGKQLQRPPWKLDAPLRGILMTAAAQILFMDRVPAHAVVDDSVELTKKLVRKNAGGLANAALRGLLRDLEGARPGEPWKPARDRLPLERGSMLFKKPVLPDPGQKDKYLSLATSHPADLIETWRRELGDEAVERVCLAGLRHPPMVIAVEAGFDAGMLGKGEETEAEAHERAGFIVWRGTHEGMLAFLKGHPARRVQDAAASLAVAGIGAISPGPKTILDLCAGRGTKTRQLAGMFPESRILTTDMDEKLEGELREAVKDLSGVTAVKFEAVRRDPGHYAADLVVADVPCSNTAVLARRPEARYRYSAQSQAGLVEAQRSVLTLARALVTGAGGRVLYTTCSLLEEENQGQARWAEQTLGLRIEREHLELPGGSELGYQDGSYHAVLNRS
ncbi:MAG: hypothetical protein IT441_01045 [Phycisphaeraceae bacterium]|nr:hypothetical protein [Phycisphaeraceae bacterium]